MTSKVPGIAEMDRIRTAEDANYRLSVERLGDSAAVVNPFLDLYGLLARMIQPSGTPPSDEMVVAGQFLLACRYQLVMGLLSCLRGHLTDSHSYTRKAIEMCAFSARVKKHPHLVMVWLSAADDQTSYNQYRERFRTGALFPQEHAKLSKLGHRYDECSRLGHPSIYSVCKHLRMEQGQAGIRMEFDACELKDSDPSEPIRTLLWTVDTHFGILQVFEEVLADVIASDRPKWEVHRNAADARLAVEKLKWQSVIRQ